MILQLNPPLCLDTTKGKGLAHFVIDYGPEHDLMWVVFMDKDGACWTVPNPEVRMQFNWTMGRRKPDTSATPTPLAPLQSEEARPAAANVRTFSRGPDS